jgi:hypothetical protein
VSSKTARATQRNPVLKRQKKKKKKKLQEGYLLPVAIFCPSSCSLLERAGTWGFLNWDIINSWHFPPDNPWANSSGIQENQKGR